MQKDDSAMSAMQATSPRSAIALVQQFRQLRVLVIGDAMLDTYLEGSATRLCSEGPVPVVHKTAEYRIPGGAANTAANIRALDAEVLFLGCVGRDLAASLLRAALQERGVSDRWLVEDEHMSTLHKLRILADGQYVVRFDEGGDGGQGNEATQQRLLAKLDAAYALCDAVIISDYRYGVTSDALIERLHYLHTAHAKTLLIDSKELQRFGRLKATVVTPNYIEACLLTGFPHLARLQNTTLDLAVVEQVATRMLDMLASEYVAITLAEHGVFLRNRRGHQLHVPAHPVAHANDVGAGDSFTSALGLALAAGGSMETAARIAVDAASIAVTKRWTAIVHNQELLQRVSLHAYSTDMREGSPSASAERTSSVLAQINDERQRGRQIVFTNGVFDILHAGHVQFLREAKALGDVLVVGVNSDSSTRRLKGAGRPINSEQDRMALVAALDAVDYVLLFDEETPTALIRLVRPAIHVKGGDYAHEALPEAEAVHAGGGRVVILPLAGSVSTTSMIDRILAMTTHDAPSATEIKKL